MRHSQIWTMDADENYAEPMRVSLTEKGAHVHDFSDISGVEASVQNGPQPHLMILDADYEGGVALDFLARLRHRKLGRSNPFIMTVLTSWNGDQENLRLLNRSGADAVLIKPFSVDDIMRMVGNMANVRRQYMACQDYIGPAQDNIGPRSMRPVVSLVPNDFHLLTRDQRVSPQMIEECWQRLMVDRARLQTGFVVDDFQLEIDKMPADDVEAWAATASKKCKETAEELKGTPLQATQTLMEVSGDFTESLARDGFRPDSADGKIVNQLAVAMRRSGDNKAEDLPYARQIAADMQQWLNSQM